MKLFVDLEHVSLWLRFVSDGKIRVEIKDPRGALLHFGYLEPTALKQFLEQEK